MRSLSELFQVLQFDNEIFPEQGVYHRVYRIHDNLVAQIVIADRRIINAYFSSAHQAFVTTAQMTI